jgi:hypothetical protein
VGSVVANQSLLIGDLGGLFFMYFMTCVVGLLIALVVNPTSTWVQGKRQQRRDAALAAMSSKSVVDPFVPPPDEVCLCVVLLCLCRASTFLTGCWHFVLQIPPEAEGGVLVDEPLPPRPLPPAPPPGRNDSIYGLLYTGMAGTVGTVGSLVTPAKPPVARGTDPSEYKDDWVTAPGSPPLLLDTLYGGVNSAVSPVSSFVGSFYAGTTGMGPGPGLPLESPSASPSRPLLGAPPTVRASGAVAPAPLPVATALETSVGDW